MTSIDIRHGDCLEVLRSLDDNSVDSVVSDPPYGLSNTKPAQVADVLAAWVTGETEAVPAKKGGFMGKDWDSFVPPPAVWAECLRVLKPGGHMAVFAGARTQDLMGLSIRLAGFEIRDTLGWIYGSGFPKSMDISKAIDKRRDERHEEALKVTKVIAERAKELGISRRDINLKINGADNSGGSAQSWTTISSAGAHKPRVPEWDQWVRLREFLNFNDPVLDAEVWRLNGRKGTPGEAWEKREVVGVRTTGIGTGKGGTAFIGDSDNRDVTAPATDAARQWSGWGTALKPAIEPIILARKPLDGTVAANVLAHGVGGLNIDECRVGTTGGGNSCKGGDNCHCFEKNEIYGATKRPVQSDETKGRFPANVLLDEHAAKEMDEQSGVLDARGNKGPSKATYTGGGAVTFPNLAGGNFPFSYDAGGGASRFFPVFKYQAKAPKKERPVIEREDGSKVQHPTVKPVALMSWLVTLITPEGGTTLDPFAGTGTTLQAARDKGFAAIGVEQDEEYIALIEQRLSA